MRVGAGQSAGISAWRFGAIHALGIAIVFAPVLFGSASFFYRDFALFGYPLAHFHKEAFWRGELPFWNPFNYFGMPFLAQWNTMTLYPLSLIYLLLPLPWSLNLFCLGHLFLAGLGMFLLARSWTGSSIAGAVAGAAYAWSGLLLNSLKWPNNIAALGLMPWVIWLARAGWNGSLRQLALAVLMGAAQMLSGAPEVIMMTWLIVAVVAALDLARQRSLQLAGRMVAIPLLVAGICAAQLLPFFDLLDQSQRTIQQEQAHWAMPLWGFANFFLPIFKTIPSYHGVPAQPGQFWVAGYYVPLIAVCMAALGLRSRRSGEKLVLAGLAGAGAVLALGSAGGLYGIIEAIPFLSFMRFPIKFVVLTVFCLSLLAAHRLAALEERESSRLKWIAWACVGVAGLLALIHIATMDSQRSAALINFGWRAGTLLAALFVLFKVGNRSWGIPALLGLIILDGATHLPRHNPVVPPHVYTAELAQQPPAAHGEERAMLIFETERMLNHLLPATPEEDVLASRAMLFCNLNLLDRKPKNDGFFSLYLKESAQVHYALQQTNIDRAALMRLLNVTRVSDPSTLYKWEALPNPLPFVQAGMAPVFGGPAAFFGALARHQFDPEAQCFFNDSDQKGLEGIGRSDVSIANVVIEDQQVSFEAQAEERAIVFLAQSFHPNWRAMINGSPAPLLRANHAYQALVVGPGASRVTLFYADDEFALGLKLSMASLALTALLLVLPRRKTAAPSTK